MNEKDRNKIFFILILIIIALGIYLVYYVSSNSYKCMSNALSYGIKNIEKNNNSTVLCYCDAWNQKGYRTSFSLDKTGIFKMG